MNWKRTALGLAVAGLVLAGGRAEAAPSFYDSIKGPIPTADVPFQNAVGGVFETDLDSLPLGDITSLILGGVTVTFSGEIWGAGDYSPNGAYGMVANQTLLNRNGGIASPAGITFSFSSAVKGFGLWIFDNNQDVADNFAVVVNGVPSAIFDFNPGQTAHTVEGFMGVYDPAGFTSFTFQHFGGTFFEVDHLQLAPLATAVPEPASFTLMSLGLAAAAVRRRRKA